MVYLIQPADFSSRFDVVSCFLEYEGKILLLHRQDHKPQGNTWGGVAGKAEEGETLQTAMMREIKEETGYETEYLTYFDKVFVRFPEYDFTYHMFHHTLRFPHEVSLNAKAHKDYRWVAPREALQMELIPSPINLFRLRRTNAILWHGQPCGIACA